MSEQDDTVTAAGLYYQRGMTENERMIWAAAFALGLKKAAEHLVRLPKGSPERIEAVTSSPLNAVRVASGAVAAFRLVSDSERKDGPDPWSPSGALAYIMGGDNIVGVIRAEIKKAEEEIRREDDE